jgi:hypothetical protein
VDLADGPQSSASLCTELAVRDFPRHLSWQHSDLGVAEWFGFFCYLDRMLKKLDRKFVMIGRDFLYYFLLYTYSWTSASIFFWYLLMLQTKNDIHQSSLQVAMWHQCWCSNLIPI